MAAWRTSSLYARVFQNAGYMSLYGGMTVDDIHKKKGLGVRERILDYMGSGELAANLFRISQTGSKLKREDIYGADEASSDHYQVGHEVRKAIERVGGTTPEQTAVSCDMNNRNLLLISTRLKAGAFLCASKEGPPKTA